MPHDDAPLSLRPPLFDDATPTPEAPALEVMARVLRLPTHSTRQARAIVKMQLDRLSPVPVAETIFDLVLIRPEGAEGLFALGITRRAGLSGSAFADRRTVTATRIVDGADVMFHFRNPNGVDDRERRLLQHAPRAAMIVVGVTALLLAGAFRAEQWREQRLPELAAQQRETAQAQRAADEQAAARLEWTALARTDASTRLLCSMDRIRRAGAGQVVPVLSLNADAEKVGLRVGSGAAADLLARAGATVDRGEGGDTAVTFPAEVCG
jgi:hypothetical protein